MTSTKTCNRTVAACLIGYVVQAIVCTFSPLLFVTFSTSYGISMTKITLLSTINFLLQLTVDLCAVRFARYFSYRTLAVAAQVCSGVGLLLLSFLPDLLPDPFVGLLISVMVFSVGGGLLEVIISPVIEACPIKNKTGMMSLLHSFFCWGQVLVIALSTVFFSTVGIEHWQLMARIWAILPFANTIFFLTVPLYRLEADEHGGMTVRDLFRQPLFWLFFVMMLCAGSAEVAVSQWASVFVERGLGISKTLGDLIGTMGFAICMGISRLIYGFCGEKIHLNRFILISAILCILSYLCIVFSPIPALSLVGCMLCGFSVGIFWPGTLSSASASLPGGTAMFALMAVAGDVGCCVGPSLAGFLSGAFGDDLRVGILAAIIFPILMFCGALLRGRNRKA